MLKPVTLALAAAALFAGAQFAPTSAAPLAPAVAPLESAVPSDVETVRWVCGPYHCVWRPNWPGRGWHWTHGWGPPPHPACNWTRGPFGAWRQVCP